MLRAQITGLAPAMRNDEEAIEHTKGHRWHSEEIHRSDYLAVIGKERRPSLSRLRAPRRSAHPVQNG